MHLMNILVPLGVCVVLPVLIVWLVTRVRKNETDRKAEIMIKAIKHDMESRFGCTDKCHNVHLEVAYTDSLDAAKQFEQELLEVFPGYEIVMRPLSLSISCHIGPGALAVAVSKKI